MSAEELKPVAATCPTCGGPLPRNEVACVRQLGRRLMAVERQLVNFIERIREAPLSVAKEVVTERGGEREVAVASPTEPEWCAYCAEGRVGCFCGVLRDLKEARAALGRERLNNVKAVAILKAKFEKELRDRPFRDDAPQAERLAWRRELAEVQRERDWLSGESKLLEGQRNEAHAAVFLLLQVSVDFDRERLQEAIARHVARWPWLQRQLDLLGEAEEPASNRPAAGPS